MTAKAELLLDIAEELKGYLTVIDTLPESKQLTLCKQLVTSIAESYEAVAKHTEEGT